MKGLMEIKNSTSAENFKAICDMATKDIKANRMAFGKATNIDDVLDICSIAQKICERRTA